jgi:hypothetical protein
MNCLKCNHKNPGTLQYCQKCGAKLDFTADEIREALVEKARHEVVAETGFHARRLLALAVVLFLTAVTFLVLSGGAPEGAYYLPSAAPGAKYVEVEAKLDPKLPKLSVPLEARKK